MFIDSNDFESWMRRIMERFDRLENRLEKPDEQKKTLTIDGERLFDNQDICFMLNICKRTLQRYHTLGWLPFSRIARKVLFEQYASFYLPRPYLLDKITLQCNCFQIKYYPCGLYHSIA